MGICSLLGTGSDCESAGKREQYYVANVARRFGSRGIDLVCKEELMTQYMIKQNTLYLATLINPVDHRLYDLISTEENVYLVTPLPTSEYVAGLFVERYGAGYIEEDTRELEYEGSTGSYYRSHTPGGVVKKKAGLGLILYSGLSLNAVFQYEEAAGIYSTTERTAEADAWWKAQSKRGYAEEDLNFVGHSAAIDASTDPLFEEIDVAQLAEQGYFGEEFEDATNLEVEDTGPDTVTLEFTVHGTTGIEFLPAVKVAESGMVVAWNESDGELNALMEEHREAPTTDVLLEVDMSTTADPSIIASIWAALKEDPQVSKKDLEKWVRRLPSGIGDLGISQSEFIEYFGQQRLPYEQLKEDTKEVAANPRKKKKHSEGWKDFFGELAYDG